MAIFQLDIADEDVQRVFDAVCGNYRWVAKVPNPEYIVTYETYVDENGDPILDENGETQAEFDEEGNPVVIPPVDENGDPIDQEMDNPENQGDFTHRMVRRFLSDHVSAWEREQAKISAANAVDTSVTISDPDPT